MCLIKTLGCSHDPRVCALVARLGLIWVYHTMCKNLAPSRNGRNMFRRLQKTWIFSYLIHPYPPIQMTWGVDMGAHPTASRCSAEMEPRPWKFQHDWRNIWQTIRTNNRKRDTSATNTRTRTLFYLTITQNLSNSLSDISTERPCVEMAEPNRQIKNCLFNV